MGRKRTSGPKASASGRAKRGTRSADAPATTPAPASEAASVSREELRELTEHHGTSPALTGGDVDADWQRASSSGEEAVGGTVATPDQDVVDELGKAVGVERAPDAPFRASSEILDERDQRRAHQPE